MYTGKFLKVRRTLIWAISRDGHVCVCVCITARKSCRLGLVFKSEKGVNGCVSIRLKRVRLANGDAAAELRSRLL